MANEAAVLRKVMNTLQGRKDCYVVRMDNAPTGTPDVIACVNGHFVGIEVKDDINGCYTLTAAQKIRGKRILNAGGLFIVVDKNNVDKLNDILDFYFSGERIQK